MTAIPRLHLFQGYGVELEYMITDSLDLGVRPLAEVLLKNERGEIEGELEKGPVAWSNELVSHVVEIKSNGPAADLVALRDAFVQNIREVNALLAPHHACLMPTAAHPWMQPARDTLLWPHESHEIYHTYDRIFGCRGHGWSNLQSTHINLPFYDDEEFARLHTAIRFILPLIPALTASSPVLEGRFTGYLDKRLYYYEKNQSKIPVITGKLIPERIFTRHGYQKHIYDRIAAAVKPFDTENILRPVWLNSRGAIARFDRGAIEIRIIDIQECASADVAIVALTAHLLKLLLKDKWVGFADQQKFEADKLHAIFREVIQRANRAVISDSEYLGAWGMSTPVSGGELWKLIIERVCAEYPEDMAPWKDLLERINRAGSLADRILNELGPEFGPERLREVYGELTKCLQEDQLFRA